MIIEPRSFALLCKNCPLHVQVPLQWTAWHEKNDFDSERNDLVWSVNLLYTSHGVQIGPLPPPLLCPIISHVCVEEVTYISDALPPHASILVDVVRESLFGKPTATHHRPFCVSRYVPQIDISWESK